ncbi:MAG: imidazole glycerol phosphate synthase subunit HisH [Rikenellaceae bacterium]
MIAIIDYNAGNILSVENALKRLGAEYVITDKREEILNADKVLFPGVGDASYAMAQLREKDLVETIKEVTQPFLGICLGMQLLCASSEEGDTECLGILPNKVQLLEYDGVNKVPNIGWCEALELKSPLFKGVSEGEFVYYVHSFAAEVNEYTICQSLRGKPFSGALQKDNFYGCQFHPEKSGTIGEKILKNFIEL